MANQIMFAIKGLFGLENITCLYDLLYTAAHEQKF